MSMGLPPGVAVASLGVPSFQQPLGEEQAPPAAAGLAVVAAGLELLEVGEGLAGEGELLLGELLGLGEVEGLGLELELELELEVVPALARPARAPKLPPPAWPHPFLSLMHSEFSRHHGLLSRMSGQDPCPEQPHVLCCMTQGSRWSILPSPAHTTSGGAHVRRCATGEGRGLTSQ